MHDDMQRIIGNSDEIQVYQLDGDEDLEISGRLVTNRTFNAYEVHHHETREVHDGFEEHKYKTKGESKDKDSNHIRQDEREAINFRQRFREEQRPVYITPLVKSQVDKTEIALLAVGEYFLLSANGVFRVQGKMLEAPWPFGLTQSRTLAAIARIRNRPHYQQARLVEPLPPAPPQPAPAPRAAPRSTPASSSSPPATGSRLIGRRRRQESSNG